jgi:hypothetical protein
MRAPEISEPRVHKPEQRWVLILSGRRLTHRPSRSSQRVTNGAAQPAYGPGFAVTNAWLEGWS